MKKKGFTLLEMIVVVMVIATLFLLTIPNVKGVMNIVDSKSCEAQCKVVEGAKWEYYVEYQEEPNSITDLVSAGLLDESQTKCGNGQEIYFSGDQVVHD